MISHMCVAPAARALDESAFDSLWYQPNRAARFELGEYRF